MQPFGGGKKKPNRKQTYQELKFKKKILFKRKKFDNLKNFGTERYCLALCDIIKSQRTAKSFQQRKEIGRRGRGQGLHVSPQPAFQLVDLCAWEIDLGEFSIWQMQPDRVAL